MAQPDLLRVAAHGPGEIAAMFEVCIKIEGISEPMTWCDRGGRSPMANEV